MLCAKFGERLPAGAPRSIGTVGLRPHDTSGCAPVGCDQITLSNEGGGSGLMWAFVEPTGGLGSIAYGRIYFNRHTNSTGGNASWAVDASNNADGNWAYDQDLYPLAPTGTSSWVSVGFNRTRLACDIPDPCTAQPGAWGDGSAGALPSPTGEDMPCSGYAIHLGSAEITGNHQARLCSTKAPVYRPNGHSCVVRLEDC